MTLSTLVALFGMTISSVSYAGIDSLGSQMTPEEFERAGLQKLDAEELQFLSDWLNGRVAEEKEKVIAEIVPVGDDRFGADEQIRENVERIRPEPKKLVSRISGNFRGWRGNTIFRLDNGQVWKQAESDLFVVNVDDPEVTIKKGFMGTYFLKIKGFGSRVKVKRLK